MKSVPAALATHLDGEVITMATCVRVTRTDGTAYYRTTSHDRDLTADLSDGTGPHVYLAADSFNSTAIQADDTLGVDNLEIEGVVSAAGLPSDDLRKGLFNFATFEIFDVNWADTSQGVVRHRKGTFGEVTVTDDGRFNIQLRGLLQPFTRTRVEAYSPMCRADLGDSRCKVPILPPVVARNTAYAVGDFIRTTPTGAPASDSFDYADRIYECTVAGTTAGSSPTYDTTVGNPTVDGTATFVARQAWSRAFEVVAVSGPAPRKEFTVTELTPNSGGVTPGRDFFPDDSMNQGVVTFETGSNAGVSMEVRDFAADDGVTIQQVLTLALRLPFDAAIGDRGRVYRGCFFRFLEDCVTIFDAGDNFRGEPHVPTPDVVRAFPDART